MYKCFLILKFQYDAWFGLLHMLFEFDLSRKPKTSLTRYPELLTINANAE